jgi:hypothetical protein
MSNHHFKEKKMSLKAKGLLSLMLSLPDDWNYSVSGLVKLSKDGKDSVMSALGELEKFGYLTRERVVDEKGRFAGIEYNIFEEPQPKKPIAEKPISAKENAEKSNAENRTQSNTILIKNLENKLCNELNTKDEELLALYKQYIQMRIDIDAPLTELGLEKLVERAERLSKGNTRIQKILLENAIINNWKNIYYPSAQEVEETSKEVRDELKNLFGLE